MINKNENFQNEVDKFFAEAYKNGWDEGRVRRKIEDVLRKSKHDDPTLFRRALYTITKILGLEIEDFGETKDKRATDALREHRG